jgi:MerR family transcriptional regulator/heat shock protein HspR
MSEGAGWQRRVELDLDDETPVFVISVAAQMAGMHPQTLRQYDRLGLVSPDRTRGRGRRYSARDVSLLRQVQRLSQDEGVSLAGIKQILELEHQVAALRSRVAELSAELSAVQDASRLGRRVFAAGPGGDVVSMRAGRRPDRSAFGLTSALVVWRPQG